MKTGSDVAQTASSAVSQTAGLPGQPAPSQRVIHELRTSGVRDFENPKRNGVHSRGYLPHVKREGATYFVTFRLADSLPREILFQYKSEWSKELQSNPRLGDEAARNLRRKIERYLDGAAGACFLRDVRIATVAREALLHFNGKRYELVEWVIMPNHVHLVVRPIVRHTLSSILQGRKTFIAREANLILGRVGQPFWQPESYDHWIRNDEESATIRQYVRNNPVRAGLCQTSEDWEWGSAYSKSAQGS